MANQVLRLGPFIGGLNLSSDPVTVENEELIQCVNLELDIDGSLISRPAIQVYEEGASDARFLIFGTVHFSGTNYLFGTQSGRTYVSADKGATWTELDSSGSGHECKTLAVYSDTVWLPATESSAGGGMSWTPSGGAVSVVAMPSAENAVVHKNRLYLCPGPDASTNESRLRFSEAGDFTVWDSADFIDVNPGDGDSLNVALVYLDNLLLFKGEATFVLAYDLNPADAVLKEINPVIGTHSIYGVVQYENTVYCIYHDKVYEIVNYNYNLINLKVPFEFNNSLPSNTSARYETHHLSLLGDRLVARYFNKTYVYGLRTRTWSEWTMNATSETVEWHIFGPLIRLHDPVGSGRDEYFTNYSFDMNDATGYKLIKILDGRAVDALEGYSANDNSMFCIATTKDFDMADPVRYKKLFWWGADILSGNQIVGSVEPITIVFSPSWEDLGTLTWSQLGTWGRPLTEPNGVTTTVAADSVFNTNKLVKLNKSLRFRKVNFSLQLETDGSSSEPTKIFSYVVIVATKQLVSAQES